LESRFRSAIADDLNLPAAMALVSELTHAAIAPAGKALLLRRWDQVLGLDLNRSAASIALPAGASELLEARERARAAKDFVRADGLRNELADAGVIVTDTDKGQRWKIRAGKRDRT
jgi:cysteinyl-tRNA synthetase